MRHLAGYQQVLDGQTERKSKTQRSASSADLPTTNGHAERRPVVGLADETHRAPPAEEPQRTTLREGLPPSFCLYRLPYIPFIRLLQLVGFRFLFFFHFFVFFLFPVVYGTRRWKVFECTSEFSQRMVLYCPIDSICSLLIN